MQGMLRVLSALAFIFMSAATALTAQDRTFDPPRTALTTTAVHVRAAPLIEAEAVDTLADSTAVTVQACNSGWCGVVYRRDPSQSRQQGYIARRYLDIAPARPARPNCHPSYVGRCIPPPPPDLDCADINGSVRVVGPDPHRLDGDGDGIGCEGGIEVPPTRT